MSQKKAATVHGDVSYETVDCMSCKNEVAKEQSSFVTIGNYHGKDSWHHKSYDEYKMSGTRTGWICQFCHDDPVLHFTADERVMEPFMAFVGGALVGMFITMLVIL